MNNNTDDSESASPATKRARTEDAATELETEETVGHLKEEVLRLRAELAGYTQQPPRKETAVEDDKFATERKLNAKLLVYGTAAYEEKFLDKYKPNASKFVLAGNKDTAGASRPAHFRVFLGPSGCGKTFSAIKREFSGFENKPYFCTLYMKARSAWNPPEEKKEKLNDEAKQGFIEGVKNVWTKMMPNKFLQMVVHVVIDEAGFMEVSHGGFSWNVNDFSDLQTALHEKAQTVIISAAGTNLETVLSGVDSSNSDLSKYRSQPWTQETVFELVPEISETYTREPGLDGAVARDLVEGWIKGVPIFQNLTDNGRAAVRLVRVLLELNKNGRNPMDNAPGVVDSVAKAYVADNGLKGLATGPRRKVVKAVLKVIAAEDVYDPKPVEFDIEEEYLKHCHGLVTSNVDKSESGYKYVDPTWLCPCKVSPCLTIVMFELLGFASKLATDWGSFEIVCALALIQEAAIATDHKFGLIQVRTPFPNPNAKDTANVPLIKTHDVVLNGERAPHGDGFGHNKIIQSKHTKNYGTVECELYEELYKSGLAKGDNDTVGDRASVHAAITALMHLQWCGENFAANSKRDSQASPTNAAARNFMYPANLLETSNVVDYNVIQIKRNARGKWVIGNEPTKEIKVPARFNPAITFAVCTNGNGIELDLEEGKAMERLDPDYVDSQEDQDLKRLPSKVTLLPDHVDRDGRLLPDVYPGLSAWINRYSKDGVHVRFHFCRTKEEEV